MSLEKEEFKERLVDDVFGEDAADGKVQMDKVTMLIWAFRDDPRVVEFLAQFVSKYSGCRDVFDGIEFYIPQLSHMIIHLEANWDDAILERFALIISQHSLHFALQFEWILLGILEDYQPEMADGTRNEAYNELYYSRVVKLLCNMDRCVVYGTPQTNKLRSLYDDKKISETEYQMLELADRKFQAAQITSRNSSENLLELGETTDTVPKGWLLFKRTKRINSCRTKRWKHRFFSISDKMIFCHRNLTQDQLLRSMPLEGAKLIEKKNGKYSFMFEISNNNYRFKLRATSQQDYDNWIQNLQTELTLTSKNLSKLSNLQKSRNEFYKGEANFIYDLTNIAETLRFEESSERKKLAPQLVSELNIPEKAYLPLCNSTDVWKRVVGVVAKETRVINTNERCPIFVYFVTKRGENKMDANLDVTEYLQTCLDMKQDLEEETPIKSQKPKCVEIDQSIELINSNDDLLSDGSSLNTEVKHPVWYEERKMSIRNLKLMPSVLKMKIDERLEKKAAFNILHPLQSVKIVDASSKNDDESASRSISTLEEEDFQEIDPQCLDEAKTIICGGEIWAEKKIRLLAECFAAGMDAQNQDKIEDDGSIYEIGTIMVKSNDDLRQEVFVMQMIHFYKSVFINEGLPLKIKTYRILSTSKNTGLIEVLQDATSIDGLKKSPHFPKEGGLLAYFKAVYGDVNSPSFLRAQRNFMTSLVGYSLVSFLLGLKDRHNGNIMIDTYGHLIFIDFGFAFGMAPGHQWSLETAPFKFTKDYMDVMGGPDSSVYKEFKRLFVAGFEAARAKSQIALGLVEIMMYKSNFPCFSGSRYGGDVGLKKFQNRLMLHVPNNKFKKKALGLIHTSYNNLGTTLYDKFQLQSNGIMP